MADDLTNMLLARQKAKYEPSNFGVRVPTAADGGATFTAGSNQGMISQGIGNLLGAINAPSARQAAVRNENISAEQTQYDRDRELFNDRLKLRESEQNQDFRMANIKRANGKDAKDTAGIDLQNQLNLELDGVLQSHIKPIQQGYEVNKGLLSQLSPGAYKANADGSLALTDAATDTDKSIFGKLENTATSYSDDAARKQVDVIYDRYAKQAAKLNIPIGITRNEIMAKLTQASDDTLNRVSSMSASQEADLQRVAQEHQASGKYRGELADAEAILMVSDKKGDIQAYNSLKTPQEKEAYLANQVLPSLGAYGSSIQEMQGSLEAIQTSGIKSVDDLLKTFAAEGDDVKDILKSGGDYLREGLADYNDTIKGASGHQGKIPTPQGSYERSTGAITEGVSTTSKIANLNDPLVLAAADRAMKTVGLDRDWQGIGNDADFNADLKRAFTKELGKLDAFRKAQEKKAVISKETAQAQAKALVEGTAVNTGLVRKSTK